MINLLSNKYFRFSTAAIIYLLIIIWIGNYWLLIGLVVLFDIYVSGKVNWVFWKKRNGINSTFIEWLDALIFAVIAVSLIHVFLFQNYKIPTGSMEKSLLIGDHLFVSKIAYGPTLQIFASMKGLLMSMKAMTFTLKVTKSSSIMFHQTATLSEWTITG